MLLYFFETIKNMKIVKTKTLKKKKLKQFFTKKLENEIKLTLSKNDNVQSKKAIKICE